MNDDCIYYIFTFLSMPDLISCSLVNIRFHNITKSEQLWLPLFTKHFPTLKCPTFFYHNFKQYYNLSIFTQKYFKSDMNTIINQQTFLLSCRSVNTLPTTIYLCNNLKKLDISYNKLIILPDEIGYLVNLQTLYANSNKLKKLPHTIGKCTSLEILQVSCNELTEIPSTVGSMISLQYLTVSYNKLQTIPQAISQCHNINKIWLRYNPLQTMQYMLTELKNLETIIIDESQKSYMPKDFGQNYYDSSIKN